MSLTGSHHCSSEPVKEVWWVNSASGTFQSVHGLFHDSRHEDTRPRVRTLLLARYDTNEDDFLWRTLIGDEKWVHHLKPKTKQQSTDCPSQLRHARSPRQVPRKGSAANCVLVHERGTTGRNCGGKEQQQIPRSGARSEFDRGGKCKMSYSCMTTQDQASVCEQNKP
jgi:hypothetical protein